MRGAGITGAGLEGDIDGIEDELDPEAEITGAEAEINPDDTEIV
jgi:hypothetical protein